MEAKRHKAIEKLVEEWGHGIKDHPNFEGMVQAELNKKPAKVAKKPAPKKR